MSNEKLDTTNIDLDRVKRDAKRLSKAHDISLCKAQNEIACGFGYQTFENLRAAVIAVRVASSQTLCVSDDPDLEALLDWFRSRFTHVDKHEMRVSPRIAKSLKQYEQRYGSSVLRPIDVGDEIDFGYHYQPFQTARHPKALIAQELLEAEGEWVANTFLDSLKIQKGGYWGDGADMVVGDRVTILAFDEQVEAAPAV
ncbi:hypothetical protein DND58_05600 [Pseudomonas syringae pv. pisi]|nr:hypothetical protein DND58_05600 [Pseudomonas syringae pv. pisi]